MMKTIMMMLTGLLCLSLTGLAQAMTLEWDRNSEPDMQDYLIWVCTTPGCTVVPSHTTFKGRVPQPPAGTVPSWPIPGNLLGRPGAVAITARDKNGNRSALSVQLSFDDTAPAAPANPRFK